MDRTIYQFETTSPPPLAPDLGARDGPAPAVGDGPRIGVIYNPRSHRNKGQGLDSTHRPGISVAQPSKRLEIAEALAGFAKGGIDYLIISGGDGTVRDVLTMGQAVFGDHWPLLAVLPKGKTNALNVDLGAPADWSMAAAIAAYAKGRRVTRRPLSIRRKDSTDPGVLGFFLGAGIFTTGTQAGQDAHQLGFFNSLAVTTTALWGIAQAMLAGDSNRWRRGTEMTLRLLPGGEKAPHSAHGAADRRSLLIASTLERMPGGVKPFGAVRSGLKLGLLDKPLRRLMLASPVVLFGSEAEWIARAGFHRVDAEGFELDIAEAFIVDGEAFPPGSYVIEQGPALTFIVG